MEQDVFVRETFGDEEAEQDDSVLVERARTDDREAFGELVRRHRAQVFGYARSFTQEPFLAEDIVQDALIRAFLHLGTLVDSRRFLPWLHRIVRNQAYTRLHASKRAKEQVFSVWNPPDADGETDWDDLDSILYRLGRRWSDPAGETANPEEALVRRELLETIAGMLRCLNPRERRIVESHFFHHLSPQEIARLFQMSPANVYQILSRSRKKLVQEKIRVAVDHYVRNRKDEGRMKRVMLNKPEPLSVRDRLFPRKERDTLPVWESVSLFCPSVSYVFCSTSRKSLLTIGGLALPRVCFIPWPTKKATAFSLPAL